MMREFIIRSILARRERFREITPEYRKIAGLVRNTIENILRNGNRFSKKVKEQMYKDYKGERSL